MASKGPRSKIDHESRAKRQKVSLCLSVISTSYLKKFINAVSLLWNFAFCCVIA